MCLNVARRESYAKNAARQSALKQAEAAPSKRNIIQYLVSFWIVGYFAGGHDFGVVMSADLGSMLQADNDGPNDVKEVAKDESTS